MTVGLGHRLLSDEGLGEFGGALLGGVEPEHFERTHVCLVTALDGEAVTGGVVGAHELFGDPGVGGEHGEDRGGDGDGGVVVAGFEMQVDEGVGQAVSADPLENPLEIGGVPDATEAASGSGDRL
ncbi:MAG: hypothetical protein JWM47_1949 [Acidimicrobiales bacterium]|nr:hypothetical protein [Acidimicrobiales bacterium]